MPKVVLNSMPITMRDAFYGGPVWKNELEAIAMPLLESYDVILCETTPGCVFDVPGEGP